MADKVRGENLFRREYKYKEEQFFPQAVWVFHLRKDHALRYPFFVRRLISTQKAGSFSRKFMLHILIKITRRELNEQVPSCQKISLFSTSSSQGMGETDLFSWIPSSLLYDWQILPKKILSNFPSPICSTPYCFIPLHKVFLKRILQKKYIIFQIESISSCLFSNISKIYK